MVASSSYFRFNQVNGHKNVASVLKFSHIQGSAAACLCLPDTAKCGALEAAGNARSRYAVIGAGLAGVATAWHLLEKSDPGHAIEVVIYDAVGVAAGGSGSAAGLLHALTPKGKLLWKGVEGVSATMQLLKTAVLATAALDTRSTSFSDGCGLTAQEPAWNANQVQGGGNEDPHVRCRPQEAEQEESSCKSCMGMRDEQYMIKHDEPRPDSALSTFNQPASFVWTNGLVRPTASLKQAKDFVKAAAAASKPVTQSTQGKHATQSTQGKHSDEGAQPLSAESLQLLSSQFEELHRLVGRSNDRKRPASLNMHDSETGVRQQQQQLLQCLTSRELQVMVPGINSNPSWMAEATTHKVQSSRSRSERREQARQQQGTTSGQEVLKEDVSREEAREREQPNSCAGLHVPLGLVVNVKAYLESLLLACTDMAAARGDGSSTTLKIMKEPIRSLTDLEAAEGPFTGIVVAGGAASQIITEVRQMGLPLQLCQGYTLVMTPP
ncbi:hypothetical protein CEUSTIGMA_g11446.t1 [Chlamydomonas eustigma]|uniref:FAD dependent oxidoreductase domain-containing protein n=1 Tax=Chlamydomonas eustigma TaxID=1157962 RepID=A0A250XLP8_9CHLO|nr:hypothetical protein CEUSTIGMA_g11446.t1 [Chlamydomonas eustigma]|eukprot:GAX84021.1 hypothetical protein CEUSTIGMA_g11446.t1 [Chlamydomonas eustigma]